MRIYRVLSRLESKFSGLNEALAFCRANALVSPSVPETAAPSEDTTTPRICVGATLSDCFTSIGVFGVFRRCMSACEDAKSYAVKGDEVYPIIIQVFDVGTSEVYTPTEKEVPDVSDTHELWLCRDAQPLVTELYWLDMYSIHWDDGGDALPHMGHPPLTDIQFYIDVTGRNHPWLNGRGHILDSSEMEDNPSTLEHNLKDTPTSPIKELHWR